MTAALLSWWTVLRLNSHWNPSSTGESSAAEKQGGRSHATDVVFNAGKKFMLLIKKGVSLMMKPGNTHLKGEGSLTGLTSCPYRIYRLRISCISAGSIFSLF